MKKHQLTLFFVLSLIPFASLLAQSESISFIDQLGKIYGVVIVVVILLAGLIFLLWRIERKLDRVEKQSNHEHKTS